MTDTFDRDERLRDFRNFLFLVWHTVLGKDPTALQYDIGSYMQHGPEGEEDPERAARLLVEAFRGVGKSWVAAAYVVWVLYWNPDAKILAVSASKSHADDISTFILQIIETVPGCGFLSPEGRDRKSKIAFDVGPAKPSKQPSVKSVGITGQMTGSRANLILADDVESLNNSLTQLNRARLKEIVKEFDSILLPGGKVIYLGTPQTEESLYRELPGRGYSTRIWPAEYPDARLTGVYGHLLAPIIKDAGGAVGDPTDPERFSKADLQARALSYGRTGYALQFMLDPSLSDEDRYPLKLRDLIVATVDVNVAPERLLWSNDEHDLVRHLTSVGFGRDRFYGPRLDPGRAMMPYRGSVMAIDPSGTGEDETAYAVVKHLNGILHVPEATGLVGGYSDATMIALAEAAKRNKVGLIKVEANFGDGMFSKLLQPHLQRIYPCTIEEVKHSTQKERRIIDTLEPVMQQHRLVVDQRVMEGDGHRDGSVASERAPLFRLFYQLTHLTAARGALKHDDRVDALSIAVAHFTEAVARDTDKSALAARREQAGKDLEAFVKHMTSAERVKSPRQTSWMSSNRGARL